jgi:hypothetical protein
MISPSVSSDKGGSLAYLQTHYKYELNPSRNNIASGYVLRFQISGIQQPGCKDIVEMHEASIMYTGLGKLYKSTVLIIDCTVPYEHQWNGRAHEHTEAIL